MRSPQPLTEPERVRKAARQRIEAMVRRGANDLEAVGIVALSTAPEEGADTLRGFRDHDHEDDAMLVAASRSDRSGWEWCAPRRVAS